MPLTDQPDHEMSIAEVSGTQKSPDPLWDDSKITYWGVTDLLGDQGTQRGYYHNAHPDGGASGAPSRAGSPRRAGR